MANHVWSSVEEPVVAKKPRTNLVILLAALLLIAIACAAFYLLRASTLLASTSVPADQASVFESNECIDECLMVVDRWNTGGKYILFYYSQPDCGPSILYGVDSIGADGKQNRLELSKQWHDRFIEAEKMNTKNPCRNSPIVSPRTKIA